MKKVILLILTVAYAFSIKATNIDSLEQLLPSVNGTEKTLLLNQISQAYLNTDPKKSLDLALKTYSQSHQKDYNNEIYAIANLVDAYERNRKYDSSDYFVREGLRLCQEHQDTFYIIQFLNNYGRTLTFEGHYPEAKKSYFKALRLFKGYKNIPEKTLSKHNYALMLNNLATVYFNQNNYDSAMVFMKQSLEYRQKSGMSPLSFAPIMQNIGGLYFKQGQIDLAIDYFTQALDIYSDAKDSSRLSGVLNNLGIAYKSKGDTLKSMDFYEKALKIAKKLKKHRAVINILVNLGTMQETQGHTERALKSLEEALLWNKDRKYENLYSATIANLATIYRKEGRYQDALALGRQSIDIYRKSGNRDGLENVYLLMSDAMAGIKAYDSALVYYKMHKNMHDSIFTTESQKNYQLLQTQFETAQKERKIQELKNIEKLRKARERVVYLAGVSLTIVLISIILVVLLKRRKDKLIHIQKERLLEKEKALVQSNLEKSQLKEQELNTQLEYKSKQLTSHALNMMQKNKFLQEVEKDVAEISKKSGDETKDKLRMLNRSIKRMNKSDKDWELFRNYFEEVNTGFYQRLGERFTGLSGNDYKLLALIKLNMNIKETASVLNISPDSVKTARYRLRKKLGLKQDDDLYEFVAGV